MAAEVDVLTRALADLNIVAHSEFQLTLILKFKVGSEFPLTHRCVSYMHKK